MSEFVTAFAPASVGNLGCGFDVLGMALVEPGDRVTVRRSGSGRVRVVQIAGDGGALSPHADRNVIGVATAALLRACGAPDGLGLDLSLEKGLPLSAGMGGSAASAVAAVVAVNALLELGASNLQLLHAALAGEAAAAGAAHPDNAAPSLLGGIVLCRGSGEALDLVPLPVPAGLSVALVHPHLLLPTAEGRALLPTRIPLPLAVQQWGNVGALVAALHSGDLGLVGRSIVDGVAEPARSPHVPGFARVVEAAMATGALGATLSGSGPSVFALCPDETVARTASEAMVRAFRDAGGLQADAWVSPGSAPGARVEAIG